MPLANGFLTEHQANNEYFFELEVGACPNCHMVQLVRQPERELMFHDEYAFFSSTSKRQQEHFKKLATKIQSRYCSDEDPFVVELGSNDGIMLKNFAQKGIRHLGVEPSENVAKAAIRDGVNTISEFFDETVAQRIAEQYGLANTISAANVICHIPYLHSVLKGVKKLLKADGLFIFEDPYLGDIVQKISYDQIYDEHVFYFSVESVSNLVQMHGMEIVDVEHLDVHGGSMRYYIAHKDRHEVSQSVGRQLSHEHLLGLTHQQTYNQFRQNVEQSKVQLVTLLQALNQKGRVAAYGATSKSTTVTNYCGIGTSLIEYISDTTPIKQGKLSPGAHIPVLPYEHFSNEYPDFALLFAWNHAKEIMQKETEFLAQGGKWVIYVPSVGIVNDSL